jgi:hypothetical protein
LLFGITVVLGRTAIIRKVAIGAALGAALVYCLDYGVLRLRGTPTGTVMVRRYYAIQEKANRVEYVFDKDEAQTCARSLFGHMGYQACWYLSRHAEQRIEE